LAPAGLATASQHQDRQHGADERRLDHL